MAMFRGRHAIGCVRHCGRRQGFKCKTALQRRIAYRALKSCHCTDVAKNTTREHRCSSMSQHSPARSRSPYGMALPPAASLWRRVCMRAYLRGWMRACVRARMCVLACMRACKGVRPCVYVRVCVNPCVRTSVRECAFVRACVHAWMRACVRACVRTCVCVRA
jgi:hypothetical protein